MIKYISYRFTEQLTASSLPLLLSPGATCDQRGGPRRLLWPTARPFIGFYKTGLCVEETDRGAGQEREGCVQLRLGREGDSR